MFQHKKVHFVCIQNESRGKIEGEKGLLSRTCRPGQNLGIQVPKSVILNSCRISLVDATFIKPYHTTFYRYKERTIHTILQSMVQEWIYSAHNDSIMF